MSEPENTVSKTADQLSDILLVHNKEDNKIRAVKGIGKKGGLETTSPDQKNENQFMRVDKHGDVLSNFFTNFLSQVKNPTHFSFFLVPAPLAGKLVNEIGAAIEKTTEQGKQLLAKYTIDAESQHRPKQQNQNHMETPTTTETVEYRYKKENIDWKEMANLGLTPEKLEKMKLLDDLLKGYKTNDLITLSVKIGDKDMPLDARLSLREDEHGKVSPKIYPIRKKPSLQFPYYGHLFSPEDKKNLLTTGNMGRVVDLVNPKTHEKISSIISLDPLTNDLVPMAVDKIKLKDDIKGVVLSAEQKQTLLEGKPLYIENMLSRKGDYFSGTVQFNAEKRYPEFLSFGDMAQKEKQTHVNGAAQEMPKEFRGRELTEDQQKELKEGKPVYLAGLEDSKGKLYNGYITLDQETGKFDFSFPNKLKDKVVPAQEHATQVAVNSDGKTNESTKNSIEPLKSGQSGPDSQKQKEAQQPEKKRQPRKRIG